MTERSRINIFVVEIDIGGGYWLCKAVGEAIRSGRRGKFRRLFRGSNYLLVVECNSNSVGWFLKIMKIQNVVVRNMVVPAEFEVREWVNFENCLKSFYMKISNKSSVDGSAERRYVSDQRQTSVKQCGKSKTAEFGSGHYQT